MLLLNPVIELPLTRPPTLSQVPSYICVGYCVDIWCLSLVSKAPWLKEDLLLTGVVVETGQGCRQLCCGGNRSASSDSCGLISYSKRLSLFLNIQRCKFNMLSIKESLIIRYFKQYSTEMQVIYAFVYYFLMLFIFLTFCLLVFALKPARRLLQHVQIKYKAILENVWFTYLFNFSFAIILIIMADSIRAFYAIHSSMESTNDTKVTWGMERSDLLKRPENESMIGTLKEFREYYLAERNIMLTASCCFVYFVFQRLFFNIRKLTNEEHIQENPHDKSAIIEGEPTNTKVGRHKED